LRRAQYAQGLVLFVDARDDRHFQEGHIPGAHQLDHFRPENYLSAVLAVCTSAEKIVVYCNGGDCEDSEFTAIMLTQAGVPADRLFIYAGGISEWKQHGEPVELGARGSGVMKETGR
jgi:rhodanese-related sulfurtransferase